MSLCDVIISDHVASGQVRSGEVHEEQWTYQTTSNNECTTIKSGYKVNSSLTSNAAAGRTKQPISACEQNCMHDCTDAPAHLANLHPYCRSHLQPGLTAQPGVRVMHAKSVRARVKGHRRLPRPPVTVIVTATRSVTTGSAGLRGDRSGSRIYQLYYTSGSALSRLQAPANQRWETR